MNQFLKAFASVIILIITIVIIIIYVINIRLSYENAKREVV